MWLVLWVSKPLVLSLVSGITLDMKDLKMSAQVPVQMGWSSGETHGWEQGGDISPLFHKICGVRKQGR